MHPHSDRIRVLLAVGEDQNPDELQDALIASGAGAFDVRRATDFDEVLAAVSVEPPDVLLLDSKIPRLDRGPPLERLRRDAPGAAIIVLADTNGDTEALRAVHAGAQDYLDRDRLDGTLLTRCVRHAVERQRLITELEHRMRALEASEAGFRNIIRTHADGIVIVDEHGEITFVNPAAERLFGRRAANLTGQPFGFPLVTGETTELDIVSRGDGALVAEMRVAETEWEGRPARLASLRDITERRRAEQQARDLIREQAARAQAEASERNAHFLGEASSILAESLDAQTALRRVAARCVPFLADWCIIDVVEEDGLPRRIAVAQPDPNHTDLARRLLDAGPDATQPYGIAEALGAGKRTRARALHAELVTSLAAHPDVGADLQQLDFRDAVIVPLRNRQRPLGCLTLLSFQPHRYDDSRLTVVDELARRAAVAIDNSRLFYEAQEANRAKGDFLAVMSHELRTPLTAVIGYSDLLLLGLKGPLNDSAREYVERIRTSARHLLMLIEEILAYARMEAGREQIHVGITTAAELVQEVSDLTEALALEKGLRFERTFPDAITIETDLRKVRQILINLLSNAVKFTAQGTIRLTVTADADTISFVVSDTGDGIGPEHLERIFEPFWQVEQARTRRAEGTGLGLSVARRLARMLGGDIYVESTAGVGTTFTVRLPRRCFGTA